MSLHVVLIIALTAFASQFVLAPMAGFIDLDRMSAIEAALVSIGFVVASLASMALLAVAARKLFSTRSLGLYEAGTAMALYVWAIGSFIGFDMQNAIPIGIAVLQGLIFFGIIVKMTPLPNWQQTNPDA